MVTILVVAFVLGADLIARYVTGHDYSTGNLFDQFKPPLTDGHILGTDVNGRDVLTRMAYGGRLAPRRRARRDHRTPDRQHRRRGLRVLRRRDRCGPDAHRRCAPLRPLSLDPDPHRGALPPGPVALAIILALFGWTGVARLVRGEVLTLRSRDFVDASRGWRHRCPYHLEAHHAEHRPLLVIWMSLSIPGLILTEAALSFLGFGVNIPTPSWGNMLQGARDYYTRSIANVIIPGVMIYITVLAINLVGKGLRDALDPRLND